MELEKRIINLEAQILALKDENRSYKRNYELAQRQNSIFEAVADELKKVVTPIKPLPDCHKPLYSGKKIRETLVLHLSDEHADSLVLPHQVGGLERYTLDIALRRAENYVDSVIKFAKQTLKNYDFHDVVILANGDHVSGEIHGAVEHSYYRNMFRNALSVGQMHSLMYRDLASFFPQLHVVYTPGNHGRRSPKKDYENPRNNWDYLVAEAAKLHCRDLKNVSFLIPDSFSVNLNIEGFGFHVTHGDDIKSWNGIPFYGIERKTRRLVALNNQLDQKVNYFAFGHFHQPATQTILGGEVLLNGAWVGTSSFVYNSLSSYTEPSQLIHGVHRDHGVTWRLNVRLKSADEHLGPVRYSALKEE